MTAVEVYSAEAGYKLSAAALAEVIEPRSLIYLIDPLNPLGSSYGRDELAAIVDLARANDAIIVHDCTYRHFADGHTLVAELYPEGTLTTYSFSKWLGLAGLRLGAVVGRPGLLDRLTATPVQPARRQHPGAAGRDRGPEGKGALAARAAAGQPAQPADRHRGRRAQPASAACWSSRPRATSSPSTSAAHGWTADQVCAALLDQRRLHPLRHLPVAGVR